MSIVSKCIGDCRNCEGECIHNSVTLSLEDDTTIECEILFIYPMEDRKYIALLPLNEDGDVDEDQSDVFLYRFSEDEEGNPVLENIEDDEEYEIAEERFDEILDEIAFEEMEEN